ncbi:Pyrroline-5-carboxylate reductase, partial [hydrothermal vent metagenome]
ETLIIDDQLMQAATVLGASGIAFWLRLIRATTQGGVQLGFDADEAKAIAVQTCLGAASILANNPHAHPESEIDKVTTPKGCTIRGLNEMEYRGLSSALIRGLTSSYEMISHIKENIEA